MLESSSLISGRANFNSYNENALHRILERNSSSGGNNTSIIGDRGIQGKRGATGEAGPIGPHGPKGVRCDIGPSGGTGVKEIEVVLDRLVGKEKEV